jgi:predicted MFS family arabinose efflux permease
VLKPSQTTLLTTLAAPDVRHRVSAVSRVAGNAGIGSAGALGGLVAARGLTGFVALLSLSPTAAFGVAAGVALAAAVSMLRLERRLPEAARLTPRPRR